MALPVAFLAVTKGIGAAFFFVKANWKATLYVITAIALAISLFWLYNAVRETAQNEARIEQLEKDLATSEALVELKQRVIALLEKNLELANDLMKERDALLEELQIKLDTITDGLGDDENDQAAESLKELIRRLQENM